MTPEQLDEIEKLAEVATPGPWGSLTFCLDGRVFTAEEFATNQDFLRTMRTFALPLVKALREAWAERDALQGRDDHWVKIAEQYEQELTEYRRRIGTMLDQLAREEADAHQFQNERDVACARLSHLLARIHRDGGHYEAKNGTAKAVVDADATVAQAFAERDEARAEVDRLKAELEEERKYSAAITAEADDLEEAYTGRRR